MMESFSDILGSGDLVLVDFFATWCQPCRTMHPILEQVKQMAGDRVRIIKVDVDRMGTASQFYDIRSVPTLMLVRAGQVLWRQTGVVPAQQLVDTINLFASR